MIRFICFDKSILFLGNGLVVGKGALGINANSIYGTPVGGSFDTGLTMIGKGQGSSITDANLALSANKQVAGQFGVNGIWPVQSFMGKSQMGTDSSLGVNLGLGIGTGVNLYTDPNNPSQKIYNPMDPALKGLGLGVAGGIGLYGGAGGAGGANGYVLGKI